VFEKLPEEAIDPGGRVAAPGPAGPGRRQG